MKKKYVLGLLGLFAAFAICLPACAPTEQNVNQGLPIEKEEATSMTVSCDLETGEITWTNVKGAVKYSLVISDYYGGEKTIEVTSTSHVVQVRKGVHLIGVYAYDANGKEIGFGSKRITVAVDVGAPDTPTGISYDRTTGVLSWVAAEGAASYKITADCITDDTFVLSESLSSSTQTSIDLDLPAGIYNISVNGISATGAEGLPTMVEFASYDIPDFNTDKDGDGIYSLLDFEDEGVLALARPMNFKEWNSASIGECEGVITNKVRTNEEGDEIEAKPTGTVSNVLRVKQDFKYDLATDLNKENPIGYFGGTTIRFPKQIEFGKLYFEAYRDCWIGFGVLIEDEKGNQAYTFVEWDEGPSHYKWNTYGVSINELRLQAPELEGVREISFYSRNGKKGNFYFDNLRYDPLGDVGNIKMSEDKQTVTWDEVVGADGYILKVNGEEVYSGANTSVTLTKTYESECAYAELFVVKGENKEARTLNKLLVCYHKDYEGFNTAVDGKNNAYYLANFANHGYENVLQAQHVGSFEVINQSHIEYTSQDDWSDIVRYDLPKTIVSKNAGENEIEAKVLSITFRVKKILGTFTVHIYEKGGRLGYFAGETWNATHATGEWVDITFKLTQGIIHVGDTSQTWDWDGTISSIVLRHSHNTGGVAPVYAMQHIYYTVDTTNFNELKAGTTDEYYVADFTSPAYESTISTMSSSTWTYDKENKYLYVPKNGWDNAVKYSLPETLDVSTIDKLKITMNFDLEDKEGLNKDGDYVWLYFFDAKGNKFNVNCKGFVTESATEGYADITIDFAKDGFWTLSDTNLSAIGFLNAYDGCNWKILDITYTKVAE